MIHLNATTYGAPVALCGNAHDGDSCVSPAPAADPFHDRVTCPDCRILLDTVKREKCLMIDPDDHLGIAACGSVYGHHGGHDWELVIRPELLNDPQRHRLLAIAAESAAASAQREAASQRETDRQRHPELAGDISEPAEAATPSGRLWPKVIARWPA